MIYKGFGYNIDLTEVSYISDITKGFWMNYFIIGFSKGGTLKIKNFTNILPIIQSEILAMFMATKK